MSTLPPPCGEQRSLLLSGYLICFGSQLGSLLHRQEPGSLYGDLHHGPRAELGMGRAGAQPLPGPQGTAPPGMPTGAPGFVGLCRPLLQGLCSAGLGAELSGASAHRVPVGLRRPLRGPGHPGKSLAIRVWTVCEGPGCIEGLQREAGGERCVQAPLSSVPLNLEGAMRQAGLAPIGAGAVGGCVALAGGLGDSLLAQSLHTWDSMVPLCR